MRFTELPKGLDFSLIKEGNYARLRTTVFCLTHSLVMFCSFADIDVFVGHVPPSLGNERAMFAITALSQSRKIKRNAHPLEFQLVLS